MMRKFVFGLFVALGASLPAQAADLRPYVALGSASVRLSDLWSGLTAGQDQIIGPSPAPGTRIMVPAAQLSAIASQFGVDWQSASANDNVVLERSGVPFATATLLALLHAALASRGAPVQFEISLTGYAPPMVAPDDVLTPMVGSLEYDQGTGDFTSLVTIAGRLTPVVTLRVSGNVAELASIPVLNRLLPAHQEIEPEDVELVTQRLPRVAGDIARSANQVVGQALRDVVPPGAPLPLSELTTPQAVAVNALVEMDLQTGGLSLEGRGIAEQGGAVGDMIRVRNPSSLAVVIGEITAANQVRVDPDSQPIVAVQSQEFAAR